MLDESCPDCNVPIMRNRGKEKLCVSCGTNYQKDL